MNIAITDKKQQLPQGWKTSTLFELTDRKNTSIVDGPFGSNLKISDYVTAGIPVLQGNNITGDKFAFENLRFISKSKARSLIRSKVYQLD